MLVLKSRTIKTKKKFKETGKEERTGVSNAEVAEMIEEVFTNQSKATWKMHCTSPVANLNTPLQFWALSFSMSPHLIPFFPK